MVLKIPHSPVAFRIINKSVKVYHILHLQGNVLILCKGQSWLSTSMCCLNIQTWSKGSIKMPTFSHTNKTFIREIEPEINVPNFETYRLISIPLRNTSMFINNFLYHALCLHKKCHITNMLILSCTSVCPLLHCACVVRMCHLSELLLVAIKMDDTRLCMNKKHFISSSLSWYDMNTYNYMYMHKCKHGLNHKWRVGGSVKML